MKKTKNLITGTFLALGLAASFTPAAEAHGHKKPHHGVHAAHSAHASSRKHKTHGKKQRVAYDACFAQQPRVDIMMDANTGEILSAHNQDVPFFPASLTKRLTLLMVLEALDKGILKPDELINLPTYQQGAGATEGSDPIDYSIRRMSVWDSVLAMNVRSSDRMPVAFAMRLARPGQSFESMMNAKALEIGMKNTHVVNPVGYPTPAARKYDEDCVTAHHTTAIDVAVLEKYLLDHYADDLAKMRLPAATVTGYEDSGRARLIDIVSTVHFYAEDSDKAIPGLLNAKTGTARYGRGMSGELSVDVPESGLELTTLGYKKRNVIFVTAGHTKPGALDAYVYKTLTDQTSPWFSQLQKIQTDETRALAMQWNQQVKKITDFTSGLQQSWNLNTTLKPGGALTTFSLPSLNAPPLTFKPD